jgi:1,2-diacylglycerol 3-alpha-glucosyltransferase
MKPLDALTPEECSAVEFICTDIDDTLTAEGRLCRESYEALWMLHDSGYTLIPVTGRPAGWCDCILRQWPVDAVVGENGAFAMYRTYCKGRRLELLLHPDVHPEGNKAARFEKIKAEVLREVPGTAVAGDQPYRLYDVAFDFREEGELELEDAVKIERIAESYGARAKISSIHVNVWFGAYDKLKMVLLLLRNIYGTDISADKSRLLYCGDSPNDESMFAFFPLTVGVSNIGPFLEGMRDRPAYITSASHGKGFKEAAEIIIKKRNKQY